MYQNANNCSVNLKIVELLSIPHVSCNNHMLNLEVNKVMNRGGMQSIAFAIDCNIVIAIMMVIAFVTLIDCKSYLPRCLLAGPVLGPFLSKG